MFSSNFLARVVKVASRLAWLAWLLKMSIFRLISSQNVVRILSTNFNEPATLKRVELFAIKIQTQFK